MGIISIIGKVVLIIVNLLILLLGIVLFVFGVIIVAGKDIYNSLLDTLRTELQSAASSAGVSSLDTSNLSLSEFLVPVAYGLIALGLIMVGLSILGLIGACCTIKIVLIVYTIIITVLFLVQLIVVILIYAEKSAFDSIAKSRLKDTLKDYSGIEGKDSLTLAWNAFMNYESCCGVDSYTDFNGLGNWPSATVKGLNVSNLKTPIICCKTHTADYTCAELNTANTNNNWLHTGCYDKLYSLIVDSAIAISACAIILALQAVLVFFSIWILCTMDNKLDII